MLDATFSWVTAGVWATVLTAYRVRVARFGSFRHERVVSIGGTALVGENVMHATYWALEPLVRGLVALGVTANMVTWSALVLGLAAGAAIAGGGFGVACLLATMSALCDVLDGQVARLTAAGSKRGALLDSVVDRYTEFAFIAGFIIHAGDAPWQVAIALSALLACFMSSYTTARAEVLSIKTRRGLMRRHERTAFLVLGAGLTPLIGPSVHEHWSDLPPSAVFVACLAIVSLVGNIAVIQRLAWVARATARRT